MTPEAFLFVIAVFVPIGLMVLAVTGWMERSPESKAKWNRVAERVMGPRDV